MNTRYLFTGVGVLGALTVGLGVFSIWHENSQPKELIDPFYPKGYTPKIILGSDAKILLNQHLAAVIGPETIEHCRRYALIQAVDIKPKTDHGYHDCYNCLGWATWEKKHTDESEALLLSEYNAICQNKDQINRTDVVKFLGNGNNIPFLIKKLTGQNPLCALEMYNHYYANNNDKLLSYTDINNNPVLKNIYLHSGADSIAFALVTAAFWHLDELV